MLPVPDHSAMTLIHPFKIAWWKVCDLSFACERSKALSKQLHSGFLYFFIMSLILDVFFVCAGLDEYNMQTFLFCVETCQLSVIHCIKILFLATVVHLKTDFKAALRSFLGEE